MLTIQIDENMKSFARETIFILQIKNFFNARRFAILLIQWGFKGYKRVINLTNDVVMMGEPCKTS